MSDLTTAQAQQRAISVSDLINRSTSSISAFSGLSGGAIAGISVAGSMLFVLLFVAPILVYVAKRHERQRAAACPVSSLSFAEHGQLTHEVVNVPRRLRKKGGDSERSVYLGMEDTESEGSSGLLSKRLSLRTLPPVFPLPRGFSVGGGLSGGVGDNGSASGSGQTPSCASTCTHGKGATRSPEKHRGQYIYQKRRKTSWIDEDALHGPRMSPNKRTNRKSNWFKGNGLTRTLSRHLSFRGYRAPELERSPTLPCTEAGGRPAFTEGTQTEPLESRDVTVKENVRGEEPGNEIGQRFPVRQSPQRGGSLDTCRISDARNSNPETKWNPAVLSAASPCLQCQNNTVIDAAQQLAGRARLPYLDVRADGQGNPRLPQSNTEIELAAILRRTAEKLQDGNRSARRQTLMLPTPSSPYSSRLPNQTTQDRNQEVGGGDDHTSPVDTAPSPAKSQRSAPAVMMYSEPEGCSPNVHQGTSQNAPPWQTHRRTHTQRISMISMLSEADSLVATPSRRGSQADILQTALSSPSRSAQTSPSYAQQMLLPRSYSPGSDQSSALSTVYSEDEDNPPTSDSIREDVPKSGNETETRDAIEGLRTYNACDGQQTQRNSGAGDDENGQLNRSFRLSQSPRPLHIRKATLGQISPKGTQHVDSPVLQRQDCTKQQTTRISPEASPVSPQTRQSTTDDPFTMSQPPTRHTPQRLSQVFSPLPAELRNDVVSPSVDQMERSSGSPTPPPSRRRVIPPPHRFQPDVGSPEPQPQVQLPSREPSLVVSEGGLSSVYESYRYDRLSDSLEGSQAAAQLSTGTIVTVPSTEASSIESQRDEQTTPTTSATVLADGRKPKVSLSLFPSTRVRANSAVSGIYTYPVGPPRTLPVPNNPMVLGYTAVGAIPRSQPSREISVSAVSEMSCGSAYSQDEDGEDKLAPLVPFHSNMATLSRHARRVASTVAELRRMNSQVSCVSGHSTATTNVAGDREITSPTLPALRGGGFSPGKKGTGGGAKNYLSLGKYSSNRDGESGTDNRKSKIYHAGGERSDNEKVASAEITEDGIIEGIGKGALDRVTLRRGSARKPRRNTVVESFEQDLDRARQVLRESREYNLQAIPEALDKNLVPGGRVAQAAE